MIQNRELWRKFEDDWRRRWLSKLTQEEAFQWMEDAYKEALSLRPDCFSSPASDADFLKNSHIRLIMRMQGFFRQVALPSL